MTALGHWTYLVWLVGCAAPILVGQWAAYGRILAVEARAIFGAAAIVGVYLSAVDGFAIADRVWEFSPALTLGARVGPVPVEEVLFFLLTSLLVTQSMTLFAHAGRHARAFGRKRAPRV
jgi:lycopene cyclase domain-containing protein